MIKLREFFFKQCTDHRTASGRLSLNSSIYQLCNCIKTSSQSIHHLLSYPTNKRTNEWMNKQNNHIILWLRQWCQWQTCCEAVRVGLIGEISQCGTDLLLNDLLMSLCRLQHKHINAPRHSPHGRHSATFSTTAARYDTTINHSPHLTQGRCY